MNNYNNYSNNHNNNISDAFDYNNNNTTEVTPSHNTANNDDDFDLPPMMIGNHAAGAGKTPALPKQEPLSGSRRQVHRRWQDWWESGKKAFQENNLPVSINGVFMTPLACLTEALEEFLIATDGGVAARESAAAGGGGDGLREIGSFALSPAAATVGTNKNNTRQLNLNFDDDASSPAAVGSTVEDAVVEDQQDLAKTEAELWSFLSQAMPLGKSAVTINGKMHTKESAMARAVQADTLNPDRWLELARVLPS